MTIYFACRPLEAAASRGQGKPLANHSWSIHEYFDRQDHYTLMFFFDANYNFYARIKVNDWVVHLSDVGL